MQKKITVLINDDGHRHEIDNVNAELGHPMIDIASNDVTRSDEIAGMLLQAYKQSVETFLREHPKDCTDCAAYQLHLHIDRSMQDIYRRIVRLV